MLAIQAETAEKLPVGDLVKRLDASEKGLANDEAAHRLQAEGPNALPEKRQAFWIRFLRYFWGPIPWMIEVAAILSAVIRHWTDVYIISALLLFNTVVGFSQENRAQNALAALKKQLALHARVLRDGAWQVIGASEIVPGDVVRVRIGDVIPADIKLLKGDFLSADQSSITGESLPIDKLSGDIAYAGSIVKQGEMVALVFATGPRTTFGMTAALVSEAGAISHFQKAVLQIGDFLILVSIGLVIILILVELIRGESALHVIQFALILAVASIPVAMPAVFSVTMAVGALSLSKMKAIVSRLASIEELAGIDVLCSDKTGTLTQNRLTLGEVVPMPGCTRDNLILMAALTCEPDAADPIDEAVLDAVRNNDTFSTYRQAHLNPFDPVRKRADAEIEMADGAKFAVSKGAPQVIMDLAGLHGEERVRAQQAVDSLASRGFRSLGVARRIGADKDWEYLGLLPLYDPPREDSKEVVERAKAHGLSVKMVTGDNLAIGEEIARQLGLGTHLLVADETFSPTVSSDAFADEVEQADGFAQVFPEHKFRIVKALQARGHLVGMTGDGVNDAPALKQADAGIAVSGATDAARAAASLVLTAPGLSVIINAIEQARHIFARMNSYAIYRIVETVRIMLFVVATILAFNVYPITAIMIILLAFFNDLPIMTISIDHTWLDPKPVRWNMRRVLTISVVLGSIGVIETFGLLIIARDGLRLDIGQIQSLVFLKLVLAGHMTLFVVRSRQHFYSRPWPSMWLVTALVGGELLATLLVVYPLGLVTPVTWEDAGIVWLYVLAWVPVEDWAKLAIYRHIDFSAKHHRQFLKSAQQSLHHL